MTFDRVKIWTGGAFVGVLAITGAWLATMGGGVSCSASAATPAELVAAFEGADPGAVICLTSNADYGVFQGGAKSAPGVTITPARSVDAQISLTYNGVTNVTVDGTLAGGTLTTSASRANTMVGALAGVVVRHLTFRRELEVTKVGSGSVLLDGLAIGGAGYSMSGNAEHLIGLYGEGSNGQIINSTLTGATVANNMAPDGIRADGNNWTIGGVGQGNRFEFFKQADAANHVDPIQMCCGGAVMGDGDLDGPTNNDIIGNTFDQGTYPSSYVSGIIGVHDSAAGIDVRDNVFTGTGTDYSIYLRSCSDCTIEHNTFKRGNCGKYGFGCGRIDTTSKATDNQPSNFRIADNIMETATQVNSGVSLDHNLQTSAQAGAGNLSGSPTFVGGPDPEVRSGFCLADDSDGLTTSSTGGPVGITTGC